MPDAPSATDLAQQAQDETTQAIDQETGPLGVDITNLQGAQAGALEDLDRTYGRVLPYVQSAAQYVGDYYKAGIAQESAIFDTAMQRLNALRGTQAAEAQKVAQATGGPVRLDAFTAPLDWSGVEGPLSAAGSLLRATGLAQGGVQEAAAFSGKVFPLMHLEQQAAIRREYQGRIDAIQKEIDRIKSTASSRTKTRLEELQEKERLYQLEQEKLKLARLDSQRKWQIDQATLRQNARDLARKEAEDRGYFIKSYTDKQGKKHTYHVPVWQAKVAGQEVDIKKTQVQIDRDNLDELIRSHKKGEAISMAQLKAQQAKDKKVQQWNAQARRDQLKAKAGSLIDAATTAGPQTVKSTNWIPITQKDSVGVNKDKLVPIAPTDPNYKKGARYYKLVDTIEQQSGPVMTDPRRVYDYLVSHGIPKGMARAAIIQRFQLPPKWTPQWRMASGPPAPGKTGPWIPPA